MTVGRKTTLTCPTCPVGMNVQVLPEGRRRCRTCGTEWGRETTHDDRCESEFITGPMAWSPCGCAERVAGRKTTPDLSAPHLCQCEDCQRIYREHLVRKAGREPSTSTEEDDQRG